MTGDNSDQKQFWETFASLWVTHQAELDAAFAPVLEGVLDRATLRPGQHVLDIGCGTGTSAIRAAEAVGPEGRVLGADISEPMLARARERGEGQANLAFLTADVATKDLGTARFDHVISRFGTMFFADPAAAFINIRRTMKPGARLTMACWSGLDENPWFRVPMYAAKQRLGAPPKVDPDAPGPLAFRDIDRVCDILTAAGFSVAEGQAKHLELTPPGALGDVARQAASIGPAARAMDYFDAGQADFEAIAGAVAKAFAPYVTNHGVRVPARINFFTARA